ncbi:MAG: hypothetical protein BWY74_00623 [Firmicutes bacterium ADurb.Bin419]|nr:MAG: hypothetical protein BWY74_00623 [Firmicutes bacterium ADurb.Bin419]
MTAVSIPVIHTMLIMNDNKLLSRNIGTITHMANIKAARYPTQFFLFETFEKVPKTISLTGIELTLIIGTIELPTARKTANRKLLIS